jgi:hypothetical protein
MMVGLLAAAAIAGCGGNDEEEAASEREARAAEVRSAAEDYLQALRRRQWDGACAQMTADARRQLTEAIGGTCAEALSSGAALPTEQLDEIARQIPGARVEVRGDRATIGPLGPLGQPLRLERQGDRWLLAGA